MNSELELYKQKRISALMNIYNSTVNRLYHTLTINIKKVSSSKTLNKQSVINRLIAQYKNTINVLTQQLNIEINKVKAFQPIFNVLSTNKKRALLIGINYMFSRS